ncbi:hypothetical protein F5Y05DRAFT_95411 [Hypoxylon sp. FL0543]|nr:hypothetical protein F5Y05DRAFT_95411 [Hypoxylon sp. FL0543]
MGCFGFSSLWESRRKRTPSHGDELHTIPKRQVPQSLRRVSEAYEEVGNEIEVRNRHEAPPEAIRDHLSDTGEAQNTYLARLADQETTQTGSTRVVVEPMLTGHRGHQRPWFKLTDEEIRAEYKNCVTRSPEVGPEFLWEQRRDSLDEESINAARGLKSTESRISHRAKLPQKLCKLAGIRNHLCPHCSNSQPKKYCAVSASLQAYGRWRQQNNSRPSDSPESAEPGTKVANDHYR